ncbi:hypothetical protein NKDENANG_02819 [Candidatus Entotheonellaceae bacterium PAL068K]
MSSKTNNSVDLNDTSILHGKRVLVTRAHAQAGELVYRLQALGAVPIVFPVIRIVPPADNYVALDSALRQLETFDWVVFTSVNGVRHVRQRMAALGLAEGAFTLARLAAIGPATADALRAYGLSIDLMPEAFVAEALLDAIPGPSGQRFLLPRADGAREALRLGLEASGATVVEVHAYRTLPADLSPEAYVQLESGVDCLTFTSSSTVRHFVSQVGAERARALAIGAAVIAIGPVTAGTARELGLPVAAVASEYTITGLLEALVAFSSERPSGT